MKKGEISEPVARLIVGLIEAQRALIECLIAERSLRRATIEGALEILIGKHGENALESGACVMLLRALRPEAPPPTDPRPDWLKVIEGGRGSKS